MIQILIISILSICFSKGIGDKYFEEGKSSKDKLVKADSLFNLSIVEYEKEENYEGVSNSLYYLGLSNNLQNNNFESINYLYKSAEISEKYNITNNYFRANFELSFILINLGMFSQATYFVSKSENYYIEKSIADIEKYNSILYNYSNIYFHNENFTKSLDSLKKIDISKTENQLLKKIYNLYGINYLNLNDYNNSYKYFSKALELYPDDKVVLINIIKLFYENSEKDSLDLYFNKYQSSKKVKSKLLSSIDTLILAEMNFYLKEYDTSINLCKTILPYFNRKNMINRELEVNELIEKNLYALSRFSEIQSVSETIQNLNRKVNKSNLVLSNMITEELHNIEFERNQLIIENEKYKTFIITVSIVLILLLSIGFLYKRYSKVKLKSHYLFTDSLIQVETLRRLIKNQLTNLLSKNMKTLIMNYDIESDEEIFRNHEEIVKCKINIENVLDKAIIEINDYESENKL